MHIYRLSMSGKVSVEEDEMQIDQKTARLFLENAEYIQYEEQTSSEGT